MQLKLIELLLNKFLKAWNNGVFIMAVSIYYASQDQFQMAIWAGVAAIWVCNSRGANTKKGVVFFANGSVIHVSDKEPEDRLHGTDRGR